MTGIPPMQWAKRIQNAMNVSRSDPHWADAQADIATMKDKLRESIPSQQASDRAQYSTDLREANTMSPEMTFAQNAGEGASFGLGNLAAKALGEGDVINQSNQANPNAALAGEATGA